MTSKQRICSSTATYLLTEKCFFDEWRVVGGKGGVKSRGWGKPLYGLFRYVFLKGYGVLAVLVTDRVSVLAILVANRGGFCVLVLNCGCFLEGTNFTSLSIRPSTKRSLECL